MLTTGSNMSRKQVFEELPIPSKVPENQEVKYIYKAVFILVKLVLDLRSNVFNLTEKAHKRKIKKVENPVIKDTDKVK